MYFCLFICYIQKIRKNNVLVTRPNGHGIWLRTGDLEGWGSSPGTFGNVKKFYPRWVRSAIFGLSLGLEDNP